MGRITKLLTLAKCNAKKPHTKSTAMQCAEMALLMATSRLGPGFYAKAKMYRRDTSLVDILSYDSLNQYKRRVNQLNDRLYQRCSQNKWIEKSLLVASGLPTAEPLGLFLSERGRSCDGAPLRSKEDLIRFLRTLPLGTKLCLKQLESWGGLGVVMLDIMEGDQVKNLTEESPVSFSKLYDFLQWYSPYGWLIERRIEQHPDYARYNQSSVNTYRVLVLNPKDSESPTVLGAYLRIGRQGAVVDNAARGGLIFPFNCENGRLDTGFLAHDNVSEFVNHPDNGEIITGTVLSDYKLGLELAKESLLATPHMNFAGVDIAFSKTGPMVIELNVLPDYNCFANLRLPSKRALGA